MEITIPTSWNDVTLEKFAGIYDLLHDKNIDAIDKTIKIISILSGEKEQAIENILTLESLKKIDEKLKFIYNLEMDKPVSEFKLGGYHWKVNTDVSKLTAGEYISLSHFVKDNEQIIYNTPDILALFCKPYKKTWYGVKKYKELKSEDKVKILKTVSVGVAYPITLFFCDFWKHYINLTEIYLTEEMAKIQMNMEKELQHLTNTGDGSQ